MFKQLHWPLAIALLVTVGVGTLFGFLNGISGSPKPRAPGASGCRVSCGPASRRRVSSLIGGWFKKVFIRADIFGIKGFPVGALWMAGFFII